VQFLFVLGVLHDAATGIGMRHRGHIGTVAGDRRADLGRYLRVYWSRPR